MLPVKKLYIDSKARTQDSKSTTNFSIDLIESLPMPEDATFIVADIIIPHTWYLISPDQNRTLYIKEDLGGGQSGQYLFEVTLPYGSYNGPALEAAIGYFEDPDVEEYEKCAFLHKILKIKREV